MKTMHMILGATLVAFAVFAGCKSIEVERKAQTALTWTDTNGVVRAVCDVKGRPVVLDGGWTVDYFQHWTWQKFDMLTATAGPGVSLTLNGYQSAVDTNLVALVRVSFEGAATLAAKVGAAIATSGGSVAGDAATAALQSAIGRFLAKGGDAAKATVACKDGNCTISDGSITETCADCTPK
ncbi:MAG: hypothetical protein K6G91_02040 [Kiritimatiellae bacterium]|nr:hypothetical protein [Kiritimatiellia bacterium]